MDRSKWPAEPAKRLCRLFLAFAAALAVLSAGASPVVAAGPVPPKPIVAYAARIAADDARARIVVEFETAPEFSVRYLDAPARIVVELPEVGFGFPTDALAPRGMIRDIRYGKSGEGRSLMVLSLTRPARLDLAETRKAEGSAGARLVFDAAITTNEIFADLVAGSNRSGGRSEKAAKAADKASSVFTVVLDAGHGGIDSGAEGVRGTKEKDVTLAFAEVLRDALEDIGGVKVVMTRTDDTFISLSGRLRLAHEASADLLLSLHADSISVRGLRGATVYTLSDKASDAVAGSLAERENRDDVVIGRALETAPEAVAGILVDLARRETRVFSTGLADRIVASFEGQVRLINNPHRQAGFRVLQAPDVPAALVELGYLSNTEDEKLLTDAAWRKKAASLLARSIKSYREAILSPSQ